MSVKSVFNRISSRLNPLARVLACICACVLILIIIICCAVPSCGKKLDFSATFYYVCYDAPRNVQSASSMSSIVHSYGGAGYIIESGGNYYVTVACYYTDREAQSVLKPLANKGLECSVVEVEAGDIKLKGRAQRNADLYAGNMCTMLSLSRLCYDLANSLDEFAVTQSAAKTVLSDVQTGLDSLSRQNASNCFTGELSALRAECNDVSHGYVLSRDVRRLQVAITDAIANITLY